MKLIERPQYFNRLKDFKDSDIKIITGVRRSGEIRTYESICQIS